MTFPLLTRLLAAALLFSLAGLSSLDQVNASPTSAAPRIAKRVLREEGAIQIPLRRVSKGVSKRGLERNRRRAFENVALRPVALGNEWAGKVTIGDQTFENICIDPASYFLVVDKGGYKPSASSVDLHDWASIGYYSGASGNATLHLDTVSLGGVTVKSTNVAALPAGVDVSAPDEDGVIGLGFPYTRGVKLLAKAPPFMEQAKRQGALTGKGYTIDLEGRERATLTMNDVAEDKPGIFWADYVDPTDNTDWRVPFTFGGDVPGLAKSLNGSIDFGTTTIIAGTDDTKAIAKKYGLELAKFSDKEATALHVTGLDAVPVGDCKKDYGVSFIFAGGKSIKIRQEDQWYMPIKEGKYAGQCVFAIQGLDDLQKYGYWIIGQTFYQSAFVSHNYVDKKLGFAQKY